MFAFRYVEAMSNVTNEFAPAVKIWCSQIHNPPVLSACMAQTVFHFEWYLFIKCCDVGFKASVKIIGMDAFYPSVTHFLFKRPTGKFKPWFIEIIAEFVSPRGPDQRRTCIS